jgi:gluconate 2-dehydrogenase gamma chain
MSNPTKPDPTTPGSTKLDPTKSGPLDFSRRDWLVQIAAGVGVAAAGEGVLSAQQAHGAAATAAPYAPKALTAHEYATMDNLAEWIVPGARAAGVTQFIDFLCHATDDMKIIFTGGLGWLDDAMRRRADGKDFVSASQDQQKAMLDLIAFRENNSPELGPGIQFFDWARRLVVDAYYTSPAGIKEVGYIGNSAMSTFSVPQAAVDYALKRSPFA